MTQPGLSIGPKVEKVKMFCIRRFYSSLLAALCLYARKLYEFTEFGKADTKLELMSNIMLSDSPSDSQSGSRTYGSSMSILPGIIGKI